MATQQSSVGIQPVFFKHSDLMQDVNGLQVCQAVADILGDADMVEGAQLRRGFRGGLWRVYLKSSEARATLNFS